MSKKTIGITKDGIIAGIKAKKEKKASAEKEAEKKAKKMLADK